MKNQATYARLRVSLTLTLAVLISAVTLVLGTATLASAQAVYPNWSYTGNLNKVRISHTTTLLSNGKVLIAGGFGFDCPPSCGYLSSAELYDPATGTWSFTGDLNSTRAYHTATLLQNGKVLIAGGVINESSGAIQTAELYDPATGIWSRTGNLNRFRYGHAATLLPNGKVLVAGGYVGGISAELYNPATGTWSLTGNLNAFYGDHTATLLSDGRVLVVAGDSSELYDPATGTWSNTGKLNTGRYSHTATPLPSGKVLVAGGEFCLPDPNGGDDYDCSNLNSAELYDPATGMWSKTGNLNFARYYHTATLLQNGKVLIAEGAGLSSAELYDPTTGTWSVTAYPNTARYGHTATLLPNGKVLVACGSAVPLSRITELYDPSADPNSNLIDDAQFFAHQHYSDFLQRAPDAGGLAFWTNETASCGNDQQCIEVKRINVSAAFFLSIEFQETGYFVYRVNKAAHGNLSGAPVPVKLDDFLRETAWVGQGVIVGQPGWEQILESNKQFFLFDPDVGDDRFTSTYPVSMTPAEFVDALFSNAGVTPSGTDRTAAISEFGSATTTADRAARARALRGVADNSALRQQEFNRAFVLMQYFGYLRRNPNDPPEPTLDFHGFNFWLNKLNQFSGNFVQAEMVKAFLVSTEYRQRFGQP